MTIFKVDRAQNNEPCRDIALPAAQLNESISPLSDEDEEEQTALRIFPDKVNDNQSIQERDSFAPVLTFGEERSQRDNII